MAPHGPAKRLAIDFQRPTEANSKKRSDPGECQLGPPSIGTFNIILFLVKGVITDEDRLSGIV